MMDDQTASPILDNLGEEDVKDPFVDPDNPKAITFDDVTAAYYRVSTGIVRTPCDRSRLSEIFGMELYLKKEFLQFTGNFKERGARYALMMLSDEKKKKGVVAASTGNHAQAVSYHGLQLGIPVIVVMPVVAPIMKVQRCRKLKATVVVQGNNVDEAKKIGLKIANKNNMTYINSYDHPQVLAGQGSMGLEILEQVPNFDAVVIPIGGGGLIAGAGLAIKTLKPSVKILGVEARICAAFAKSLEAGKVVNILVEPTLADGLAVPIVGHNSFKTAKSFVEKVVVAKEESIALAILRLLEVEKCVAEGAGAAGLGAVVEGQLNEFLGKKVVLILSGGNIDTTILGRCIERGLAADGRLIKVTVCVSDRPGGLAELIRLIGSIGVNIRDITHERAWVIQDVFSVNVTCICETRDAEHSAELRKLLKQQYKKIRMEDGVKCTDRSTC